MNREIKFRAWDRERNTMLYEPNGDIEPTWILHNNLYNPFCPDYELMQYTGLKDKNGVEIYEGDIVSLDGSSHLKVMKFTKTGAFMLDAIYGGAEAYRMEVKGNIYQNPELIK